jgi:outer membrane lipoprotein-sorting protein
MHTFALSAMLLVATPALAAEPTAAELLAKVDRALTAFHDAVFESRLVLRQADGKAREYQFTIYQKNPGRRLVRFSAPGDVKGMGVLVENDETMYVFLPGFQRVRRMGAHIKNQSFMGSDFSFQDMSELAYSELFTPRLIGSDDKSWILELTAKPGVEVDFPTIHLWADKTIYQPTRLEYFDPNGKLLRTQLRLDYTKDSPQHYQPGKVVIIDHRRNDHQSEIVFTSAKIDSGLPDDLFSVRSLMRGP